MATKSNLVISIAFLEFIEGINFSVSPDYFKLILNNKIEEIRDKFDCEYPVTLITPKYALEALQALTQQPNTAEISLIDALASFVGSKYKENILDSTDRQLAQR